MKAIIEASPSDEFTFALMSELGSDLNKAGWNVDTVVVRELTPSSSVWREQTVTWSDAAREWVLT